MLSTLQPSLVTTRKLTALVQEQPLLLKYHNGPLLKGNTTVNLIWYGVFSASQHAVVVDFLRSLTSSSKSSSSSPSVASWWLTTARYRGGPCNLLVGRQLVDDKCSLGKRLSSAQLAALASRAGHGKNQINVVLTSADVAVDGFCSRCGTHGSGSAKSGGKFAYAWVGNAVSQCPGQCAWPFHQPNHISFVVGPAVLQSIFLRREVNIQLMASLDRLFGF
ncbi:unnamed protein product [Linum tenue]|uniref:Uncharacterized protein n=5 Tax=Linum tenue TaxID=586396 RepID=A0AAV0I430_9ROSI|nr:unnamed protein product [Linum tenue]